MRNLETIIAFTVYREYFKNRGMFTLLDITNKVNSEFGVCYRHSQVREIAREYVEESFVKNGVYVVTSIIVNTPKGKAAANLYHPLGTNPNDYVNVSQVVVDQGTSVPATQAAPAPPAAVSVARDSNAIPVNTRDSDGALTIPKAVLVKAGLVCDTVDVINHPNSITIQLGTLREVNDDFRVSYTTLAASNLDDKFTLYLSVYTDKIVITR